MKRAFDFWVQLTSEEESALGLAMFRIAIGLLLIATLASAVWSGCVDAMWIDSKVGGAVTLGSGSWLTAALGGPTPTVIYALLVCAMLGGVLVAAGALGRLGTLVAALAYGALVRVNPIAMAGYDALLTNALYLLFLSGANATLSVDARVRTRSWCPAVMIPAWPRYLLIFQLIVVYFTTGLQKFSPVWGASGNYSALYWVFQDPTWRRFDMNFASRVYPALQVLTFVTWYWEILFPILLLHFYFLRSGNKGGFLRRVVCRFDLRKPFVGIGILIHLGIAVTLNVGPFSFVCLAYYLLFLRAGEAERLVARVRVSDRRPIGAADHFTVVTRR